jgi:hypothetical protein
LTTAGGTQTTDDPADKVVYRPPLRGAPGGRIGAATRGLPSARLPAIDVLAPNHVGLTVREHPTLYWFISAPTDTRIQLTIVSDDSEKPLVEADAPRPVTAGIHAFRLSDYHVRLQPGVEYQWSVAMVTDPNQRSKDRIAIGHIKRVTDRQLAAGDPIKAARDAAAASLWYDSVDLLSQAIDRGQESQRARLQRAGLLQQVGLNEAADFERAGK